MDIEPVTGTAIEVLSKDDLIFLPDDALSDDDLVNRVRRYNDSTHHHLLKSIQAFWLLGSSLNALYQRRHLYVTTTWEDYIQNDVGIGRNTANQARRLASSCEYSALDQFKSRTDAMRQLKILAARKPVRTVTADVTSDEPGKVVDVVQKPARAKREGGRGKDSGTAVDEPLEPLEVLAMVGARLDSLTVDKPSKEVKAQLKLILATVQRLLKADTTA